MSTPTPKLFALQDSLALALGVTPGDREITLTTMLHRSRKDAVSYWLQIFLAMGIATLGLVLGSTGVVIGAMLISPLMEPIVGLGMGLAVGSPFLTLRSVLRVAASIVVVVGCASGLTLLLPFHELTPEILARTSPTVLDLIIAAFCALTAVFTTIRASAETASTAAGTAIGISLVPPLCVVGYGIGSGSSTVAKGAALLFTANFSAIVMIGTLSFLLLGYAQVGVLAAEADELAQEGTSGLSGALANGLRRLFRPPWGSILRVLLPLLLLSAVFVPLRQALVEVSWQVRVRAAVVHLLEDLPRSAVRTNLVVDRGGVQVRLVVVGKAEQGARIQQDLEARIRALGGGAPRVEVVSVPDEATLREVAAALRPPEVKAAPLEPASRLFRRDLRDALGRLWPQDAAGLVAATELSFQDDSLDVRVLHWGPPLGPAAERLLSQALSEDLGITTRVGGVAIPLQPVVAATTEEALWLSQVVPVLDRTVRLEEAHACVRTRRPEPRPKGDRGGSDARSDGLSAALERLRVPWGARWEQTEGDEYSLRFSPGPCTDAGPPPAATGAASASPLPEPTRK